MFPRRNRLKLPTHEGSWRRDMFQRHFAATTSCMCCLFVRNVTLSLLHVSCYISYTSLCYMSQSCETHTILSLQHAAATCPYVMTPRSCARSLTMQEVDYLWIICVRYAGKIYPFQLTVNWIFSAITYAQRSAFQLRVKTCSRFSTKTKR